VTGTNISAPAIDNAKEPEKKYVRKQLVQLFNVPAVTPPRYDPVTQTYHVVDDDSAK
jgi:hypothetical protein